MELRNLLIVLLLFSGIVIGLSNFAGNLAKNYGSSVEDLSKLGPIQRIQEEASNLEQSLRSTQITGTFLDVPLTILSGVYSIFKLILVSFIDIWAGFIGSISSYLMLPEWFVGIVIAIISIIVIFEIISIVAKYKV